MEDLYLELCRLFSVSACPRGTRGPFGVLLAAILRTAGDPDAIVGDWLSDPPPIGIMKEIPCTGVFPKISAEDAARAARNYAPADHAGGSTANYSSYLEFTAEADFELRREQQLGFMVSGKSENELRVCGTPLVPSKIAVIVKKRVDGSTKVRLVHDLSRSGVNHRVRLPERVVLPRLGDVMVQALRLLRGCPEHEGVRFMVLDFSDAFKQLRVSPEEQAFLAGRWTEGWFRYLTVMFGIASGPLVWGRVAAALMRLGQSTFGIQWVFSLLC